LGATPITFILLHWSLIPDARGEQRLPTPVRARNALWDQWREELVSFDRRCALVAVVTIAQITDEQTLNACTYDKRTKVYAYIAFPVLHYTRVHPVQM
jgi:hypothetical protein